MHKIITGGIAVTLGLSTALATGAFAGGNGAQRSGLSPAQGDNTNQCVVGSGSGTNGFTIVNAPGKPGAPRFVNGEVSLKRGQPDSAYTVWIVDSSGNCTPDGAIATNTVGNGNAHLDTAGTSGTYYIVLQDAQGNEQFASGPVTVN